MITDESTPLLFNSRKILMETITLTYPGHISHWDPAFKSCSSYFRFRKQYGRVTVSWSPQIILWPRLESIRRSIGPC